MSEKAINRSRNLLFAMVTAMIAFAALSFLAETASAATIAEGECGDNARWTLDDEGVLTVSGEGEIWDFTALDSFPAPWKEYHENGSITEVHIGEGITKIGSYAFKCAGVTSSIKEVEIADSVEAIGDFAFEGCEGITAADLPAGLKTIGQDAFNGCSSLPTVVFPETITKIGIRAFKYCSALSEVVIPKSIVYIGSEAFAECAVLKTITIQFTVPAQEQSSALPAPFGDDYNGNIYYPGNDDSWDEDTRNRWAPNAKWIKDGDVDIVPVAQGDCGEVQWELDNLGTLKIVGEGVVPDYNNCQETPWYPYENQIKQIIIGDKITRIGSYSMSGLRLVKRGVEIPESVKEIGEYAFYNTSITSARIPGGIEIIGKGAFQESAVVTVEMSEGINVVSEGMFKFCNCLENITLPDTLTNIENDAFWCCSSLTEITIPKHVVTLSEQALVGCTNLQTINLRCPAPVRSTNAFFDFTGTVYYPRNHYSWDAGQQSAWAPNATWKEGNDAEVETIADGECGETIHWTLNNLGSLTISGEGEIPDFSLFSDTPWYIHENIIRKIVIEDGVTGIGNYAFSSCKHVTGGVVIPDSVLKLGNHVFSGTTLESLKLGNGITTIPDNAFAYCTKLKEVTFPENVKSIGHAAFMGCADLDAIELPETITNIGQSAFGECTSLTVVTIPSKVTYMQGFALSGCTNLQIIILKCPAPVSGGMISDFDGLVYYTTEGNTWNESLRKAWAPNATWKDGTTITYNAKDDTNIVNAGTETVTFVSDEEVQEILDEIQLVKPKHVVVNAKISGSTEKVISAKTKMPASIAKTASEVHASFTADTVVGTINLDNASVAGAVSSDTESIELDIANNVGKKGYLTDAYDIGFRTYGAEDNNVVNLMGKARITVPVPKGTFKNDVIQSVDIETGKKLTTLRKNNSAIVETSVICSFSTSSRNNLSHAKVTIKKSPLVYNGKKQKPKPTVTIKGTTVSSKHYTVTYSKNKAVGKAEFTVKARGTVYHGSKKGTFKIKPKKAAVSAVKTGKRKITVTMKTKPSATGGTAYKIKYRIAGKGKWKTITTKSRTVTIKKLKKGKRYQVRAYAYKGSYVGATSATKKSGKVK